MPKYKVIYLMVLVLVSCDHAPAPQSVTILHFTDYHSNALPSLDDSGNSIGGIARTVAYLRQSQDANTLVFNGGDMMNKGAPVWSDKYQCREWAWFNGIVDAMALGNHETDYGSDVLAQCLTTIDYPLISSNVLTADGSVLYQYDDKDYLVYQVAGQKIGVFALAGSDFADLLTPQTLPVAGVMFADRVETAKRVVLRMKSVEKVDAIILIGHGHFEDDVKLAQQLNGIDLILGTHSHRKQALMQIPNTNTWYISSFQYLSHISRVKLTFNANGLAGISGGLIAMSEQILEDPLIAAEVAEMQAELESDPVYAEQFKVLGNNPVVLNAPITFEGESLLGNFVTDLVRQRSGADVVMLTSSTFRKSIPDGVIKEHHLTDALPYDNKIFVHAVSGKQLKQILDYSVTRIGSDFFSQVSGIRFTISQAKATDVKIGDESGQYHPLDDDTIYRLATSDFQSLYADGYKRFFVNQNYQVLPETVRQMMRTEFIKPNLQAELDSRITRLN